MAEWGVLLGQCSKAKGPSLSFLTHGWQGQCARVRHSLPCDSQNLFWFQACVEWKLPGNIHPFCRSATEEADVFLISVLYLAICTLAILVCTWKITTGLGDFQRPIGCLEPVMAPGITLEMPWDPLPTWKKWASCPDRATRNARDMDCGQWHCSLQELMASL